ncbi:MAG: hypothetical protein PUD90_06420 [Clostridia bacterium]|nr:hypothetical protein [Clostridia bacterium]
MKIIRKFNWWFRGFKGKVGHIYQSKFGRYYSKKFAGKIVHDTQYGNDIIRNAIENGIPFAASRFGFNELSAITNCEGERLGLQKYDMRNNFNLYGSAGFFPDEKWAYEKYYEWHINNIENIDLLAVCFNKLEDYIIEKYMKNTQLAYFCALEPYYHDNPWTMALKGKKVLVISPFSETIKKQYAEKREKLYDDERILPQFELKTIKAVQSIGGESCGFADWFEALDSMINQMKNIDFDVAIIGCGAYGMPLAIEAKKLGKQAIHLGGPVQILFGIKGKRWDEIEAVSKFYNTWWVRPSEEEKPDSAQNVEDGCYW